ncbi:hypothetical protein R1flu_019392 [Riccia fluitans]|uniref:Uncharacterized protein n=1 Tax=Riccia fluitans TaxID=41844 RepID=A0ABD1ZM05_9MARC
MCVIRLRSHPGSPSTGRLSAVTAAVASGLAIDKFSKWEVFVFSRAFTGPRAEDDAKCFPALWIRRKLNFCVARRKPSGMASLAMGTFRTGCNRAPEICFSTFVRQNCRDEVGKGSAEHCMLMAGITML